MSIFFQAV
jgi:hypothetical protein